MGGCMGQWVGSGQMTNLIKLELINIIWFCLKIYNLSRHPYLWVDGWVNGWAHVKPLKSNKSWPNRDNSIMDILDILLDILLKPPQPFIGLFFNFFIMTNADIPFLSTLRKPETQTLGGLVIWNFSVWLILKKLQPFFNFFIMANADISFPLTLGKLATQTLGGW